jgi:hypothetical protein
MVYCGKPSKGCAPCRIKRTKVSDLLSSKLPLLRCYAKRLQCDLWLPSCGQCIRTGRYYSGYRLEAYGEFRDQSREVVLRQSALQKKRHNIAPSPTCQSSTDIQSLSPPQGKSVSAGSGIPLQGRSCCFVLLERLCASRSERLYNHLQ